MRRPPDVNGGGEPDVAGESTPSFEGGVGERVVAQLPVLRRDRRRVKAEGWALRLDAGSIPAHL